VFAVWGAPLADSRQAQKAARAACLIHAVSEREIQGRRLKTRIGVHTGNVLQGNLGSLQQFDYTCIGDAVNLAARMEGLNKYLGTNVLVSGETLARMGDGFVYRCLGDFQLAGKRKTVTVYEVLGEKTSVSAPEYYEPFERGLAAYRGGDFATAALLFKDAIARRGGRDGPSEFYLARMAMLDNTAPQPWEPVVSMEMK
jgi:adenylate cyclase